MSGVPGVLEIGRRRGFRGPAVARAAKLIEGTGRKTGGLDRFRVLRIADMAGSRAVAVFTAHAGFSRSDTAAAAEAERSGGMAAKTAQDRSLWIEDAIVHPAWGFVARSASVPAELAVPGLFVLEIISPIQAAYECNRLYTGAESPFSRLAGIGPGEGARVARARLRSRFGGMALRADGRTGIILPGTGRK